MDIKTNEMVSDVEPLVELPIINEEDLTSEMEEELSNGKGDED